MPIHPPSAPEGESIERLLQEAIDAVVMSQRMGCLSHMILQRLIRVVEDSQELYAAAGTGRGPYLSPESIANAYEAIDDETIRTCRGFASDKLVTNCQRIQHLETACLPALEDTENYECDEGTSHLFVPLNLSATSGEVITLIADVQGECDDASPQRWHGPVASIEGFLEEIEREGWVAGVDAFRALQPDRKLAIASGRMSSRE